MANWTEGNEYCSFSDANINEEYNSYEREKEKNAEIKELITNYKKDTKELVQKKELSRFLKM